MLTYAYADDGQMRTASMSAGAGAGTYTFAYDALGRQTSQIDLHNKRIA